jgi:steroid delta-isomerase-like uncharacterized protein
MNSKRIIILIILFLILPLSDCTTNHLNENKSIATSFIKAWSTHDAEKLTSLFSANCLYEEVPSGRKFTNKQDIANYLKSTVSGIPDSDFEIVSVTGSDSTAAIEWIWKGTNTVGWPSLKIPATNKYFEVRGVSVMTIENNLIKRNRDYWDWNTFLTGIDIAKN